MKMVMRKYFAISGFLQYYVPEKFSGLHEESYASGSDSNERTQYYLW
jgi:hypothetical protein